MKGGYSTEMIVDPRAWHGRLFSHLRCVCVCVFQCLLTTSPISMGPLQRLGSATITAAPICQLISSVKIKQAKREGVSVMKSVVLGGGNTGGNNKTEIGKH